MAEINWTEGAHQWLRDIYEYIEQDNPSAARSTIEAIYNKAQILREFPKADFDINKEWIVTFAYCCLVITE